MAQSDLTIENQSFPSFRTDLNNALTALNSMHSGTSRPASAVAGTMWLDTTNATNPTIKFFDGTDDITFATVDYSANTINFSDSASDLLTDTTPQLGGMLDVNGQAIGDGTLELIKFLETASAVNEITITNADTTNAPEISATGDDTDIDLKLTPKGDGKLNLDGIKFPNADGTVGQALTTDGSGSLAFSTISGGASAFRNIVINGDMSIAQRGTTITGITTNSYTLDRWTTEGDDCTLTVSQSTDVPTGEGFSTSLKLDVTTANGSADNDDLQFISTFFEGQNLQYLKKGTANAVSLTLSFWCKMSQTGTYIVRLFDEDNARHISKSFTILSADTWEKKTITYEGDTTGAFGNDNGRSLRVQWILDARSDFTSGTLATSWESSTGNNPNRASGITTGWIDSTSSDFYLTGVQLEAGTTDTDFEFLPYDVNLGRCERYYQLIDIANGNTQSTTKITFNVPFRTETRAAPSVSQTAAFKVTNYHSTDYTQSSPDFAITASRVTVRGAETEAGNFTSLTGSGTPYGLIPNEGGKIILSAEL
jgi:hypothetical protein